MTQTNNNNDTPEIATQAAETIAISTDNMPEEALNSGVSEVLSTATDVPPNAFEPPVEATAMTAADDEPSVSTDGAIELNDAKRVLEAALLAANEAMQINELRRLFDGQINAETVRILLDELKLEWQGRSVELNLVAGGYRFRVKPQYQPYLDKLSNDRPPKYSRAVMETLAIIAYRQPVTRADIEDVRGVQVSPHILKVLEDRGWVEEIGHKEVVGRPALFATTKHFLDDLNLRALDELPPLHELQSTLENPHAASAQAASLMDALERTPMAPTQHYVDEIPAGTPYASDESEADHPPVAVLERQVENQATNPDTNTNATPETPPAPASNEDNKSW